MKKLKKVRGSYTIRALTDAALRQYAEKTQFDMSLIVDLAIEEYLKSKEEKV